MPRRSTLVPLALLTLLILQSVLPRAIAALPDYLIDVWETEDNLPSSIVTSIAQTPDGYLWVGTYDGLARFDGVRFVTFEPGETPEISHARIQGLYVDSTGTLWINTFRGGLTSYRNGNFRREWPDDNTWYDLHTTLVSSSSNEVVFVTQFGEVLRRLTTGTNFNWKVISPPSGMRPLFNCVGGDGTPWFLNRVGRIVRFQQGEFKELADDGFGGKRVLTLVTDSQGQVWAGATNQIARWDGNRFENMTPTNGSSVLDPTLLFPTRSGAVWVLDGDRLRKMEGRRWTEEPVEWRGLLGWAAMRAMGAHEDSSGGVWFNHYGNGLFHITPEGQYQRITMHDGLPGERVGAWFQGRDGGIWLGVDRGGLARLRERRFQVIGQAEGLAAPVVLSLCQDTNGAMWIGTAGGGLYRWSGNSIGRFSIGNNASADFVFSMFPRSAGGIWLSAAEGEDFFQFTGERLQKAPWEVHGVKSILIDRAGRVWMGTKSGLGWWSATGRRIFGQSDGVTLSAVRALTEAPDGSVWAGADDGKLYCCQPDQLQSYRPSDAQAGLPILSLAADRQGTIWAGTFRGGLLRFRDGRFSRITSKQGLPADNISQILEDNRGRLWLGTHQGICCVAKSALNEFAEGRVRRVDCVTYGKLDGLPTLECSDGYQPACWRDRDGRLWFATVKGVVSVNPDELLAQSLPPPVVIEELRVDGDLVTNLTNIQIPPGHKQFELRFTALSFEAPDKIRFRYRMDGVDADWVEAGTRRTAQYANLSARDYRFQVIACDNQGAWSEPGAVLKFTVQPFFYQTWWFILLVSAAVLAGVVAVVRTAAAREYQRELARIEQQHAVERDRARIAKDIHDDIGAGLTQITLLSELAQREKDAPKMQLERISESARQLTRAMDEIVWAVDPQHDTFSGLMDYISAFAEDYLRTAGIRCRMDLPTALPEIPVEAEVRYNLFLALKEALNNVVKHAHATEVWLRLHIGSNFFTLIVEDNGQGLPVGHAKSDLTTSASRIASGLGLSNLEARLNAVGGRCVIHSDSGKGTRVELTVNGSKLTSPIMAIGPENGAS